jgi:hypothetical protein
MSTCPPGHHLLAMADEQVDHLPQGQLPGAAVGQRQTDHPEVHLQLRVGEQLVEHHLGDGPPAQLDDDAHAVAIGLVAQIGDAVDLAVLHQVGDAHDQVGLVDLVGELADDQLLPAGFGGLQGDPGPHHDLAPPRLVGVQDPLAAEDEAPGGEVRAPHDAAQLFEAEAGPVDHGHDGRSDLPQVVRRYVGGHAHGDAAGAVDQQKGQRRRQHQRLLEGVVVIGPEIHRFLVDVPQHLFGDLGQARLGVAHGRRRVPVDGPEVPLTVDDGVAHGEVLGQAHQGVVHGGVPVRVVLAENIPHDAPGLLVGPIVAHAHLVHGVEDAPVHRLQPVAHVRQRPADDDRHGVVEIRLPDFVLDGDGDHSSASVAHARLPYAWLQARRPGWRPPGRFLR